ncbi:uncharacterized protein N7515_004358 [Penicillium bovifimosum]|uniref:Ankyrin n=1 Tax=Penicillium bovifimosum TaxID=126998 RepID=A0A9W9H0B5_9EURO|nr:uncharacterized protein N7515_004358 [Penicillium bovifimosum]KAJ5135080.1 hypothetical protein N7515_004358 [Penicillium bovifimosum]
MSAHRTPELEPISRVAPSIPSKTLLMARISPERGEPELQEFLDRAVRDGYDINDYSEVMIDAIRSRKMYLVKALLRCNMPVSSIYVLEAVKNVSKDTLTPFLTAFFENGWDINAPISGRDPPVLAKVVWNLDMTIWLLDRGADPNERCDFDCTPLSYAVREADLPTIDLLLRRGGDVRIGQLLHNAMYRLSGESGDILKIVEMLVDRGASLNSLMYQDHQYSWTMFPFMRETPLHIAVAYNRHDVIRYLIHKGANVEIENYQGETVVQSALHEATKRVILQEL